MDKERIFSRVESIGLTICAGMCIFATGMRYGEAHKVPEKIVETKTEYVNVIQKELVPVSTECLHTYEPTSLCANIVLPHDVEALSTFDRDVCMIAQTIYGEANALPAMEKACVAWTILNRVDSSDPYFPDSIQAVITQPNQFLGYTPTMPITEDCYNVALDVLCRWYMEKSDDFVGNVGRCLPADYISFYGDGKHNYFSNADGVVWDYSTTNPYEVQYD